MIQIFLVSRLCSEIIERRAVEVPDPHQACYSDVFMAVYNVYPKLQEDEYSTYCRYSRENFFEITDYFSYMMFLVLFAEKTIYVLLKSYQPWEDNLHFLISLDYKEILEKIEKERDIYDVRFVKNKVLWAELDRINKLLNEEIPSIKSDRTNEEVLQFAVRKIPEPWCYTQDLILFKKLLNDLKKGKLKFLK